MESSSFISALLLAAGRGERMGGVKQLLPLGEQRMIEAALGNLQKSRVDEIIVVLGFAAAEICPFVEGKERVTVVMNPLFEEGMSTSIHEGLLALDPRASGILIALADQPLIPPEVINKLIEGFVTGAQGIVLPAYQGQQGHPVIFDRKRYEGELLALQGDVGGREIVETHPDDVLEVEVASRGIVIDIDAPEDYKNIQGES
ncbi:MAG: nucleotidyltransferase family protein [Deltaproteobacteria bacterium]|nr:nucleotidyltransferase family protein [Deltaproteobacteria bacterium]